MCHKGIVFGLIILLLLGVASAMAQDWKELLATADSLSQAQKLDSAIAIGKLALQQAEAQFGPEDTAVARVLYILGEYEAQIREYAMAEPLIKRSLTIREKFLGSDHPDVATSLNDLAVLYYFQSRYAEAEPVFKRSLAIRERALGPNHSDVAESFHNLASLYEEQGKYAEAEPLYMRSLAIREKTLGPDHPDVATLLNNIAGLYYAQGRYAEAVSLFKRSLEVKEKSLGPNHPDVAAMFNNIAVLYYTLGKLNEAEPFYRRSLVNREEALGPEHPDVANSLNNLATLYQDQGRYGAAEPLYMRSLAIREKALGPEHLDVASSLNNLATLYQDQGQYAAAEPLFKRSLAITEKALGPDHPDVANSLNNVAGLYALHGRYVEAEPLLKRSLAIKEKALGPDHPGVATSLNSLGRLYQDIGRYSEAEQPYQRSLAIREKALGPDHPAVAKALNNLAVLYYSQGRRSEAEPLFVRSLTINEKALGPDHPEVARSLGNIASLYQDQSKYAEAESLYSRAITIEEKTLGPDHPDLATMLTKLAQLYSAETLYAEAEPLHNRSLLIMLSSFVDNSIVLPEKDCLSYASRLRRCCSAYLSWCVDAGAAGMPARKRVADAIFSTKGLVTDVIVSRQLALTSSSDSVTTAVADSLRLTRFELSKLFVQGPGKDLGGYRNRIDSLQELSHRLEGALARYSAAFRTWKDQQNVSADRIASLLGKKRALVEYVKFDYFQSPRGEAVPRYVAVVLNGSTDPAIVDLGDASIIDAIVGEYRQHMAKIGSIRGTPSEADQDEYRRIRARLSKLVWLPLEPYVDGMVMIFLAPDGALDLVSFAGLNDSGGSYLVEKHAIHYLSAGRDLIRLMDKKASGKGLYCMADPDYDASLSARLAKTATPQPPVTESEFSSIANVRSGCGELNEILLSPLPGTRKEIELAKAEWERAVSERVTLRLGSDASEDRFKAEASGHRVIHLATHGYYLEDQCQPDVQGAALSSSSGFVGENPLLLSGLFLAGANLHGVGADSAGAEDGVLTAYEVSAMDLEGTDMVVLSACETGLGEVKTGEGVYGLRRAFQMAGAKTVVSALWQVPDWAMSAMMSQLYDRSAGSLPETIRGMQMNAIVNLRKQGKPDHPYTWGAFIATGEWR